MRTFSFFIHNADSATPTLMFDVVSDEVTLKSLAEKALAESRSRLAVEIREADRLVYSLDRNGVTWPVEPSQKTFPRRPLQASA
jgi:hypothetical protein